MNQVTMADEKQIIERVHTAIERIKAGGMVIMVDDEDRENEGDLVLAAEKVNASAINFMAKEARGLICLTLDPEYVRRLKLPMMGDPTKDHPSQGTAFTVSIEARDGVSTGISAADRARTVEVAIADDSGPDDIVVPGHIFPLRARQGGVLERAGHTEGSVDLARLAGCKGAGVICEIMNDDGTMARMPDLETFSEEHQIPIVAIADLIHYRLIKESLVEPIDQRFIHTAFGQFEARVFRNVVDKTEHLALIKGQDFHDAIVDVRVHSQRPIVDAFGDRSKVAGHRFAYGLELLNRVDHGVLLYINRHQSSILAEIEELGRECLPDNERARAVKSGQQSAKGMDLRLHGLGAQILRSLGVRRMRIHTSSPLALKGLSGFGLEIVDTAIIQSK